MKSQPMAVQRQSSSPNRLTGRAIAALQLFQRAARIRLLRRGGCGVALGREADFADRVPALSVHCEKNHERGEYGYP